MLETEKPTPLAYAPPVEKPRMAIGRALFWSNAFASYAIVSAYYGWHLFHSRPISAASFISVFFIAPLAVPFLLALQTMMILIAENMLNEQAVFLYAIYIVAFAASYVFLRRRKGMATSLPPSHSGRGSG